MQALHKTLSCSSIKKKGPRKKKRKKERWSQMWRFYFSSRSWISFVTPVLPAHWFYFHRTWTNVRACKSISTYECTSKHSLLSFTLSPLSPNKQDCILCYLNTHLNMNTCKTSDTSWVSLVLHVTVPQTTVWGPTGQGLVQYQYSPLLQTLYLTITSHNGQVVEVHLLPPLRFCICVLFSIWQNICSFFSVICFKPCSNLKESGNKIILHSPFPLHSFEFN